MSNPAIFSVTVSCEFGGEQDYGKGTKSYMNLSGRWPEPGVPIEEIDDVIDSGIDMYLAAWKAMLTSRCAIGILSGKQWKEKIQDAEDRVTSLRRVMRKMRQAKEQQNEQ
jgi:hypothetical protein